MRSKKLRSIKLGAGAVAAAALTVALAVPAGAESGTHTVDATVEESISITTPEGVVGWTLRGTGVNKKSAGTFTVTSNTPYTVTVVGEKNTLTEWDTTLPTPAYVSGGAALTSPLTVTPTRTGGTAPMPGAGVPGVVTNITGTQIAAGFGLGTDVFSLEVSQPTTVVDEPLGSGRTYHNRLTYTATTAL